MKYKNISNFSRTLTIGGKRILLNSNDIIQSERELDLNIYDFLQKVDDKATTSPIKEISSTKTIIPDINDIKNIKSSLDEVKNKINESDEIKTQLNLILKRLDSMKNAVETVNKIAEEALCLSKDTSLAVKDLQKEVYEHGGFIITGLDDEKETKDA